MKGLIYEMTSVGFWFPYSEQDSTTWTHQVILSQPINLINIRLG
jgi:hypothetical protein